MTPLLNIIDLSVTVAEKKVIDQFSLAINPGSIHAIMGPNGSGKSSLAQTLVGNSAYQITHGSILYNGMPLAQMSIHQRARSGLFVAFQHPVELPGVLVFTFLYETYRACTSHQISVIEFKELLEDTMELLGIDQRYAQRQLNVAFSGGEKKMLELLQLVLLRPRCAVLDEIDSGLDVDALKKVTTALELAREENPQLALVVITHYQRLLAHVSVDYVHVMHRGRLVASGASDLAHAIEREGYHEYRHTQL